EGNSGPARCADAFLCDRRPERRLGLAWPSWLLLGRLVVAGSLRWRSGPRRCADLSILLRLCAGAGDLSATRGLRAATAHLRSTFRPRRAARGSFSEWKVRPLRRRDESAVAVGVGRRCPGRSASTTSALIGRRRSSLSNRRSGGLCSRPGSCDLCHRLNDQVLTLLLLDKSVRRSTQFGAEVRVSGRLTIRSSSQIGCGRSRG